MRRFRPNLEGLIASCLLFTAAYGQGPPPDACMPSFQTGLLTVRQTKLKGSISQDVTTVIAIPISCGSGTDDWCRFSVSATLQMYIGGRRVAIQSPVSDRPRHPILQKSRRLSTRRIIGATGRRVGNPYRLTITEGCYGILLAKSSRASGAPDAPINRDNN
jgi:hypothetical protein